MPRYDLRQAGNIMSSCVWGVEKVSRMSPGLGWRLLLEDRQGGYDTLNRVLSKGYLCTSIWVYWVECRLLTGNMLLQSSLDGFWWLVSMLLGAINWFHSDIHTRLTWDGNTRHSQWSFRWFTQDWLKNPLSGDSTKVIWHQIEGMDGLVQYHFVWICRSLTAS